MGAQLSMNNQIRDQVNQKPKIWYILNDSKWHKLFQHN